MSPRASRFSAIAAILGSTVVACSSGGPAKPASQSASVPSIPVAVETVESGTVTPPVIDAAAPPANVSYADAETAFRDRRYAEATGLFSSYVATHPDNPWGHYMYGLSAWRSGEREQAMAGFDEALRLDPNHRKSMLNSARVLLETSRPREALERIERALSIEPLSGEGLRLLGRARHQLDQVPEAIDAYQRAITLDDRDVWAMNNLGLVYLEQERSADALLPLARAVQLRSNAPVFQNNLGMALERSGHTTAARQAYAAALQADSTYAKASASLTRLGGPVEAAALDSTQGVDITLLAREFQTQIEQWRNTTAAKADSVGVEEMTRDTVAQE